MKTLLFISLLSFTLPHSSPAADSLGELAQKSGHDWMAGKWVSTESGANISYEWLLDRHAISMTFKMGTRESQGLMVHVPGTDTVTMTAADNAGGVTTGVWSDEAGNLVLKAKHIDADGNVIHLAIEHIKTGADTMTAKVYGMTESGTVDTTPKMEITYKRQK